MPQLSAPVVVVAGSFLTAMQEFQAEGRGGLDDDTMIGAEIREWQRRWDTASRRVIQANRGVLEDERGGMLRFWIRTDRP